jgi:hypothetical protein
MFDTLPGGAGFARRAGQLGVGLFTEALKLLEGCRAKCDRSCYRCLRSYKNKFEHDLLDRYLGASLLRYLLEGGALRLETSRLERSTDVLFHDLDRQGLEGIQFHRDRDIEIPGIGKVKAPILVEGASGPQLIIGLHAPLTPDEPSTEVLRSIKEYSAAVPMRLVDEIAVDRNMPRVVSDILSDLQ